MAARLKLYVDWFSHKLKNGPNAGSFTLPSLYQGAILPMQVQIIEPNSGGNPNQYDIVDPTNLGLQLAIFATQPIGTASTPVAIVTQFSWSTSESTKAFQADVKLNTAALNSHIAAATSVAAWLELKVTEGGATTPIFQSKITIAAGGIEATTASVPAGETPLSMEVASQMFATRFMEKGDAIIFQSQDETKHIKVFADNDNSFHSDPF